MFKQNYWNNNSSHLEAGLADSGSYDQYLYSHLQMKLQEVLKNEEIDDFLNSKTVEEQQKHFETLPLQGSSRFLKVKLQTDVTYVFLSFLLETNFLI